MSIMNELIITKAVKEDLPIILDIQKKSFGEVAKTFNLKSMPQIEQTLESLTDEFINGTILKASFASKVKPMSFRTYVRNLKVLNLLKSRFLASLRNDTKIITTQSLRRNDEDNTTIIGSVRAYTKNDTCYINRLIVLPKYQNKGIGKALMSEIENQFKNNVARYELFTGSRDPRNLYLYSQLGYKSFKTEKHNDHSYEPQASIGKRFYSKLWGFIPSALRDCSTNQFRYSSLSELEFHNDQITFVFMEKTAQGK
jgi:ribosomal protein S18 acetylase RimI-like enzyme